MIVGIVESGEGLPPMPLKIPYGKHGGPWCFSYSIAEIFRLLPCYGTGHTLVIWLGFSGF